MLAEIKPACLSCQYRTCPVFHPPLDKSLHTVKPNGIHTIQGGNWNAVWKEFFEANPNATKGQILQQLQKMRKAFRI
jgi:hypothetical protein